MEFNASYGGGERFDEVVFEPEVTYRTGRDTRFHAFVGSPRGWRVDSIGGWNWRARLSLSDALYEALQVNDELRVTCRMRASTPWIRERWMKLICTRSVVGGPWPVASGGRPPKGGTTNRRGTAEIELMLAIPVLLVILFLTGGSLLLDRARMANAYNAENDAYTQVVSGTGFTVSGDPVPADGFFMPLLPNRYVMANELKSVQIQGVQPPIAAQLDDQAILLDPAWHFSAWPQSGDRGSLQGWFTAYVGESHPADIVDALELAAPGPP